MDVSAYTKIAENPTAIYCGTWIVMPAEAVIRELATWKLQYCKAAEIWVTDIAEAAPSATPNQLESLKNLEYVWILLVNSPLFFDH